MGGKNSKRGILKVYYTDDFHDPKLLKYIKNKMKNNHFDLQPLQGTCNEPVLHLKDCQLPSQMNDYIRQSQYLGPTELMVVLTLQLHPEFTHPAMVQIKCKLKNGKKSIGDFSKHEQIQVITNFLYRREQPRSASQDPSLASRDPAQAAESGASDRPVVDMAFGDNLDDLLQQAVDYVSTECHITLRVSQDIHSSIPLIVFCKNDSKLQEDIRHAMQNTRGGCDVMLLVVTDRKDKEFTDTEATKEFGAKSFLIYDHTQKRFRYSHNKTALQWIQKTLAKHDIEVLLKMKGMGSLRDSKIYKFLHTPVSGSYHILGEVSEEIHKNVVIYFQDLHVSLTEQIAEPLVVFCLGTENPERSFHRFKAQHQDIRDIYLVIIHRKSDDIPGYKSLSNCPSGTFLIEDWTSKVFDSSRNKNVVDGVRKFLSKRGQKPGLNQMVKAEPGTPPPKRTDGDGDELPCNNGDGEMDYDGHDRPKHQRTPSQDSDFNSLQRHHHRYPSQRNTQCTDTYTLGSLLAHPPTPSDSGSDFFKRSTTEERVPPMQLTSSTCLPIISTKEESMSLIAHNIHPSDYYTRELYIHPSHARHPGYTDSQQGGHPQSPVQHIQSESHSTRSTHYPHDETGIPDEGVSGKSSLVGLKRGGSGARRKKDQRRPLPREHDWGHGDRAPSAGDRVDERAVKRTTRQRQDEDDLLNLFQDLTICKRRKMAPAPHAKKDKTRTHKTNKPSWPRLGNKSHTQTSTGLEGMTENDAGHGGKAQSSVGQELMAQTVLGQGEWCVGQNSTTQAYLSQRDTNSSSVDQVNLTQSSLSQESVDPSLGQRYMTQTSPDPTRDVQCAIQQGVTTPSQLGHGNMTQLLFGQGDVAQNALNDTAMAQSSFERGHMNRSSLGHGNMNQSCVDQGDVTHSTFCQSDLPQYPLGHGHVTPFSFDQGNIRHTLVDQSHFTPSNLPNITQSFHSNVTSFGQLNVNPFGQSNVTPFSQSNPTAFGHSNPLPFGQSTVIPPGHTPITPSSQPNVTPLVQSNFPPSGQSNVLPASSDQGFFSQHGFGQTNASQARTGEENVTQSYLGQGNADQRSNGHGHMAQYSSNPEHLTQTSVGSGHFPQFSFSQTPALVGQSFFSRHFGLWENVPPMTMGQGNAAQSVLGQEHSEQTAMMTDEI